MQKTVNGLTNNQAATFDFDSIEFKRPGTYVFSVVENARKTETEWYMTDIQQEYGLL